MTVGFGVLTALIVLGVAVFFVVRSVGSATRGGRAVVTRVRTTCATRTPAGQDPPILLSAPRPGWGTTRRSRSWTDTARSWSAAPWSDAERARVRSVIGSTHSTGLEGKDFHPGEVVFVDEHRAERPGARENDRP